jgi:hypothetical protein
MSLTWSLHCPEPRWGEERHHAPLLSPMLCTLEFDSNPVPRRSVYRVIVSY